MTSLSHQNAQEIGKYLAPSTKRAEPVKGSKRSKTNGFPHPASDVHKRLDWVGSLEGRNGSLEIRRGLLSMLKIAIIEGEINVKVESYERI